MLLLDVETLRYLSLLKVGKYTFTLPQGRNFPCPLLQKGHLARHGELGSALMPGTHRLRVCLSFARVTLKGTRALQRSRCAWGKEEAGEGGQREEKAVSLPSHGSAALHQPSGDAGVLMHLPPLQQLGASAEQQILRGAFQRLRPSPGQQWSCSTSRPRLCLRAKSQPKKRIPLSVSPSLLKNKGHSGIYLEVY